MVGAGGVGGVALRGGAHAWVFFTASVAAETARRLGAALFPSQDVLPAGGVGNLIAAPLHGKARHDGATVFLDLASAETLRKNLRISAARSRMLFRLSEPSGLAIETRTWWRPVSLRRNDQVSCHRACEGSSPIRRSRQPTR